MSPQPSLGCASCNCPQPATCTWPQGHRAAPLWLSCSQNPVCFLPSAKQGGGRDSLHLFRTHRWGGERSSDLGLIEPSSYNRKNEQRKELRHPQKNQPSFCHCQVSRKFRAPERHAKVHRYLRKNILYQEQVGPGGMWSDSRTHS